jgi:drug/metabolite transporter (DMT)-like permease
MKEKKVKTVKVKSNSDNLGIIGITITISSLVILLLGNIAVMLMPFVGLVLSCVQQKRKPNKIGKIGIIVSSVAIVLLVLYIIFYVYPQVVELMQAYSANTQPVGP